MLHAIPDMLLQNFLGLARVSTKRAIQQLLVLADRRLISELKRNHLISEITIERGGVSFHQGHRAAV